MINTVVDGVLSGAWPLLRRWLAFAARGWHIANATDWPAGRSGGCHARDGLRTNIDLRKLTALQQFVGHPLWAGPSVSLRFDAEKWSAEGNIGGPACGAIRTPAFSRGAVPPARYDDHAAGILARQRRCRPNAAAKIESFSDRTYSTVAGVELGDERRHDAAS